MSGYYLISYLILWLLVIGLGLVILALAREVDSLLEAAATGEALTPLLLVGMEAWLVLCYGAGHHQHFEGHVLGAEMIILFLLFLLASLIRNVRSEQP